MLEQCDMRTSTDMPSELLEEWKVYRQRLRDLPAVLEAAGVTPMVAYYMFPEPPQGANPVNGAL